VPAVGPSSVQLATNNRLSDAVKAKSFRTYKDVLFVPPADDRRNLAPRIAEGIGKLGYTVRTMDPRRPLDAPQGTAFVIDAGGWLLTAAHVVGTQREATVTLNGKRLIADVFKADAQADLALLKLREAPPAGTSVLRFRPAAKPAQLGEEVSTLGYPLSRLLGNSVRMSRGLLSATAGLRDDPRELQVSAEIQPGSSGGPLLDRDGNVIGVIVKTLNPQAVARASGGALPQNVNFAVKGAPVLDFIKGADKALFDGLATPLPEASSAPSAPSRGCRRRRRRRGRPIGLDGGAPGVHERAGGARAPALLRPHGLRPRDAGAPLRDRAGQRERPCGRGRRRARRAGALRTRGEGALSAAAWRDRSQ
jgi:S1-C subfamily serine protease